MIVTHSRPTIDQDDIRAVSRVLASGNIAQGKKVKEFENELAKLVGTKHAIACSSGTTALHLALLGLGVGPRDEVIMPSYVCSSVYQATLHTHATPKVVDIDLTDLNLSADTIKQQLSPRTKALIVPHMFGTPAKLDELLELGIPIIEDCAQSLGAEHKGRKVGSIGELSIFSFYATKMITTGEGGMVLTNNSEFYSRINDARDCDNKPPIPTKYNYKMTDFQAALGLSQLKKLQHFIQRRRQIASLYTSRFSEHNVTVSREHPDRMSVFYRYIVMVDKLEYVQRNAKKKGVMCEKPVWKPLHNSLTNAKCPNADYAYAHALSVPLYPGLSEEEIQYVVENLETIFRKMDESAKIPMTHYNIINK